jgi:hypothetical protein
MLPSQETVRPIVKNGKDAKNANDVKNNWIKWLLRKKIKTKFFLSDLINDQEDTSQQQNWKVGEKLRHFP